VKVCRRTDARGTHDFFGATPLVNMIEDGVGRYPPFRALYESFALAAGFPINHSAPQQLA
jgi:hypothetical protein